MQLQWVKDVVYQGDAELERARRVEIYRQQVEGWDTGRDERLCRGPYARPVLCQELGQRFATLREAARFINVNRAYLRMSIRRGTRCKGYLFSYIEGEGVRVKTGQEKAVRCLSENMTFDSLTAAAQWAGLSLSGLAGALRESRGSAVICGGKVWEYAQGPQIHNRQLPLFNAGRPVQTHRTRTRQPAARPGEQSQLNLFI